MTDKSDTPRVDADEEWATSGTGDDFQVVHASFARELERELAAKDAELSESRAQVARLRGDELWNKYVEEVRRCSDVPALLNFLGSVEWHKSCFLAALSSLPEQSKRDARVLKAAEELSSVAKRRNDDCLTGALITPEIDAIHEIIQAVRGDKT